MKNSTNNNSAAQIQYALIERNTANGLQVTVFNRKNDALKEKKSNSDFYNYIEDYECLIKTISDIKIKSSIYDEDLTTAIVKVEGKIDNETETASFYVQLTGGDYLPQMGCWITTINSSDDCDFDEIEHILYETSSDLIRSAEQAYKRHSQEILEEDSCEWEEVEGWAKSYEKRINVSATASADWILEENKNCDSEEKYRLRIKKSGHISPNDYASFPDFEVEYFDTIENAREFILEENE